MSNMVIVLEQDERDRFAAYLEQNAESNIEMSEVMEKLGGAHHAVVTKMMKNRAAAFLLVAKYLRSIEEMNVR